jgi:CBS domain-containing protein
MAAKKAGAIIVVEGDRLIGIFIGRDVVSRVVAHEGLTCGPHGLPT